jgi:hypothetical protein
VIEPPHHPPPPQRIASEQANHRLRKPSTTFATKSANNGLMHRSNLVCLFDGSALFAWPHHVREEYPGRRAERDHKVRPISSEVGHIANHDTNHRADSSAKCNLDDTHVFLPPVALGVSVANQTFNQDSSEVWSLGGSPKSHTARNVSLQRNEQFETASTTSDTLAIGLRSRFESKGSVSCW